VQRDFEVQFAGGEATGGHLNPEAIELAASADAVGDTVTWQIHEVGKTAVLYAGSGEHVKAPLGKLKAQDANGTYEVVYLVREQNGDSAKVSREFSIDTGDIPPGKYL
jgi:hypothetical protein